METQNIQTVQIDYKPPIESQLSVKVLDSGCLMMVTSFIIVVGDVGIPEFASLSDCLIEDDDWVVDDVNGDVDLTL
ncbi:hypothetical protein DERF_002098 [Dermatophagoides farinae]|uniref:Uncharacterized protein n=1 Tax=Dermatophagoides farinae TaxID=6954 RepID=A0A922LAA4_DERFA|nr:hypothetical protein DERF_002098 [Dermatophagoides farinae]